MMSLRTPGLVIFSSALLLFTLSLNGVWAADHPVSLLELSYSIWAHHSIILGRAGQFNPGSVDTFVYNGNYYSALDPGTSFLALPFVGIGFVLDGGFSAFGHAMLASEFFVAFCNAIAAYLMFKLASLYFSRRTAAFLAFAYAFATIGWPFVTFFFESDVAAMLDLLAVYLAIRMARTGSSSLKMAIPCGAALGATLTVDYINAVLVPVVSIFLLYSFRRRLAYFAEGLWAVIVFAAAGVVLIAQYNEAAFGDPFLSTEQAYQHVPSLFARFSYPILDGLYINLLSPLRGIFIYCPVLMLGLVGFYCFFFEGRKLTSEGFLLAACFVAVLVPYSMWFSVTGGEGFGQRFLIPVIPFLLLPAGFVIESRVRSLTIATYLFYVVGVVFNGIAAITTTIPQPGPVSSFPFLTVVVPNFLGDALDAWWWRQSGSFWWEPVVLIVAAAALMPLVAPRLWKAGPGGPKAEDEDGKTVRASAETEPTSVLLSS
jgi:hypothetical protein